MPGEKPRIRKTSRQEIPCIQGRQAAKILAECDSLLLHSDLLANLPRLGFAALLSSLSKDILQLALQPDSWGERTRTRLMSDIVPTLQGDISKQNAVSIDDITHCTNIVMPCLLLELGRRDQHIEIEFPPDPTDSSARFKLRAGKSCEFHSINNERLVRLASSNGEDLVGLCYFGDQKSRDSVETELSTQHAA